MNSIWSDRLPSDNIRLQLEPSKALLYIHSIVQNVLEKNFSQPTSTNIPKHLISFNK